MGNNKIEERVAKCKETNLYKEIKDIEFGTLYFNGEMLDVQEFLKGNKVVLDNKNESADNNNALDDGFEIEFVDF